MAGENSKEGRPRLVCVDAEDPDVEALEPAARALRTGRLVAFPTETVYGLGAHALDERAVARIFEAKNRPATNPLIVHVADADGARRIVVSWPQAARKLAEAFWPGPLTLVLQKASNVPDVVTASLDTVAVRMPAHPVARRLIELAGVPVAAPSANRYTEVSPTRGEHVVDSLGGAVDWIVDAGPTSVGVESTIVSLADGSPEILRPGMITVDELEETVGEVEFAAPSDRDAGRAQRSPGRARRHYAPTADLRLVDDPQTVLGSLGDSMEVGWLLLEAVEPAPKGPVVVLGKSPGAYAQQLYHSLREFDASGCEVIVVERPPSGQSWRALRDRLERAAR